MDERAESRSHLPSRVDDERAEIAQEDRMPPPRHYEPPSLLSLAGGFFKWLGQAFAAMCAVVAVVIVLMWLLDVIAP
jgi:hypothetical protein